MQSFLKSYVGTMDISAAADHVGMVDFASSSRVAFPFSDYYTKEEIWRQIDATQPQGGDDRRIDNSLQMVSNNLFSSKSGARRDAKQVRNAGDV